MRPVASHVEATAKPSMLISVDHPHALYHPQNYAVEHAQVESENHGKIVAIDLLTGDFEVAIDSLTAAKLLMIRHPDTQIFCIRIGHRAVHRFTRRL